MTTLRQKDEAKGKKDGTVKSKKFAELPNWSVNAINVKTGVKVLQEELSQPTYTLNTSQWEPGVYVVRGFTGGDVIFAEKICVK